MRNMTKNQRCTIGIDIGGTNLRLALVDSQGGILARLRSASDIVEGSTSFCNRLLSQVEQLLALAATQRQTVTAIGMGIPGLIDSDGTIISSINMQPLEGLNLGRLLERQTGITAWVDNDANCIALGEMLFGAGRPFSSAMVITIGTGLGSGLILDGKLWRGVRGFAAEFGHITLYPDGHPCPCGNRGCLEQYVSAGALVRHARIPATNGQAPSTFTAEEIARQARNKEIWALEAYERMGKDLGIALASLANTLNLQAVIIGGGVAAALDLMLPSITDEISRRSFSEIGSSLSIIKGLLGDDAGLLGGAALATAHNRNQLSSC